MATLIKNMAQVADLVHCYDFPLRGMFLAQEGEDCSNSFGYRRSVPEGSFAVCEYGEYSDGGRGPMLIALFCSAVLAEQFMDIMDNRRIIFDTTVAADEARQGHFELSCDEQGWFESVEDFDPDGWLVAKAPAGISACAEY